MGPKRLIIFEVKGPSGLPVSGAEVFVDDKYRGKTSVNGVVRVYKSKYLLGEQVLLAVQKSNAYVEYMPHEEKILFDRTKRQFMSVGLIVRGSDNTAGGEVKLKVKNKPVKVTKTDLAEPASPEPQKPAHLKMVESQLKFAENAAARAVNAKENSQKIMHANNAFHAAEDALVAAKKISLGAHVKALRSYRGTMDKLYKTLNHEPFKNRRDSADKILLSH